jgi:cytochrome c
MVVTPTAAIWPNMRRRVITLTSNAEISELTDYGYPPTIASSSIRIVKSSYFSLLLLAAATCHAQDSTALDPKRGELLFQTCSACHTVLGDGVGPSLYGIFGRRAGTQEGFKYSSAMTSSGLIWDDLTLRAFVKSPQSVVKGTAMTFPGYTSPADVDNVVAYMKTLH